jgi:hypothetical protein
MEFTEGEAKAKISRRVRVQHGSLLQARLAQGTEGVVVGAQLYRKEEGDRTERVWVVCLEFFLTGDRSASVLLRDIGKEQYVSAFEELPAELTSEPASNPEGSPSLRQTPHPTRGKTLTLVRRSRT